MHALNEAWEVLKRDFDAACGQIARAARCQITNELNQSFRRLRHYQSEGEWVSALLDSSARFVQQVAVLSLSDGVLTLRGQHNLTLPDDFSFPVFSAGAFASAIDTRDPVVAMRKASEVTEPLSAGEGEDRAHLFPIANGDRVVAVLFAADQEYMDANALELIAGIAAAVLERRSNSSLHAQIGGLEPSAKADRAVSIEPPQQKVPAWADLSEEERSIHLRAQRFSRVTVAEIQLAHPEACRAGREQSNVYMFLKKEIDTARVTYRKQFMTNPTMVDYLHLELIRISAEGDESKMGAEYPGQLV